MNTHERQRIEVCQGIRTEKKSRHIERENGDVKFVPQAAINSYFNLFTHNI